MICRRDQDFYHLTLILVIGPGDYRFFGGLRYRRCVRKCRSGSPRVSKVAQTSSLGPMRVMTEFGLPLGAEILGGGKTFFLPAMHGKSAYDCRQLSAKHTLAWSSLLRFEIWKFHQTFQIIVQFEFWNCCWGSLVFGKMCYLWLWGQALSLGLDNYLIISSLVWVGNSLIERSKLPRDWLIGVMRDHIFKLTPYY